MKRDFVNKPETYKRLSLIDKINLITMKPRVQINLTKEEQVFLDMKHVKHGKML